MQNCFQLIYSAPLADNFVKTCMNEKKENTLSDKICRNRTKCLNWNVPIKIWFELCFRAYINILNKFEHQH